MLLAKLLFFFAPPFLHSHNCPGWFHFCLTPRWFCIDGWWQKSYCVVFLYIYWRNKPWIHIISHPFSLCVVPVSSPSLHSWPLLYTAAVSQLPRWTGLHGKISDNYRSLLCFNYFVNFLQLFPFTESLLLISFFRWIFPSPVLGCKCLYEKM